MAEKGTGGRRPATRFLVWAEQWLLGSTRTELTNEERAVFMDFLCLAALRGGCVEVYSRDQLAAQLLISRELLDRCVEKFVKTGKIQKNYKKREKKEIFCLIKWEQYQPEYLWKDPKRLTRKDRGAKGQENDAHVVDKGKERKTEENKKNEMYSNEFSSNSPLHSTPTIKDQFLLELKNCKDYPFDEVKDSLLFDTVILDYPRINIMRQVKRKIEWWKTHPDALKANTRKQLQDFFKEEAKFQKRGGPQKIGDILEGLEDADHRNWIKRGLLGDSKEKAE